MDYKDSKDSHYETGVSEAPYGTTPKPTFGQKVKNHFKKYWWVHVISTIVITLCITLPLSYVGFPNIAQKQLNQATIDMVDMVVTNPQANQVHLRLVTDVHSPSMYTPTLDPFKAALFLEDTEPTIKPFGYVTIPSQHVQHDYTVTVDQDLEIADMEQFIAYNKAVLMSDTYRVAMRGVVALHLGKLPVAHPAFNKVITSKGLNKLAGFKVVDFNLSLDALPGEPNMFGTASIPNQSNSTIFVGDIIQNIFVDGTPIGNSSLKDVTLRPGLNLVPLTSITDQAAVIGLLGTKYKNGILPIDIIGSTVTVNGTHLPYYEQAFAANPLSTSLDVGAALAKLNIPLSALTGGGA